MKQIRMSRECPLIHLGPHACGILSCGDKSVTLCKDESDILLLRQSDLEHVGAYNEDIDYCTLMLDDIRYRVYTGMRQRKIKRDRELRREKDALR